MKKPIASKISSNFLDLPTFTYLGETFQPCRQFTKKEENSSLSMIGRGSGFYKQFDNVTDRLNFVTNDYDHKEFYVAAKEVGGDQCDVFLWHGKELVPCENQLFYLKGETPYKNEKEILNEKKIVSLKKSIKAQETRIYLAKQRRDDYVFELHELLKIK